MANIDTIDSVISTINNIKTLKQLQCEQDVLDLKATTKCLYDFTKEQFDRNTSALPELVTEGFDEEQIWQQLELQNESELTYFLSTISKVVAGNKKLVVPVSAKKHEPVHIENDNFKKNKSTSDDKELEDENIDLKSILKKKEIDTKKRKRSSIVDDKFFKLQELNEYLTKEERKEKYRKDNIDSDDESVDFFNDFSDEDNDDTQGKYLKYTDFFDSPLNEDDQFDENKNSEDDDIEDCEEEELASGYEETDNSEMEKDEDEQKTPSKRVKFNLTNDSDETDSLENKMQPKKIDEEEEKEEEEDEEDDAKPKSSLETRQENLLLKIKELEEEMIADKSWQFKGEVSGPNRPQNSLLEEFVEFDLTTRPAPIITEETTLNLEDIIKQRIKDKAWDDVEKKFKPVETPLEYKKKLVMNQEKSKESLSKIYENEYLKQRQALKPDEEEEEKKEDVPELHREIKRMMRSLMSKLDALSNYHYTPRQVKPELKIVSNMPAINMEEVAPVATSDATMLAPEEIKAKMRGDLIGKSERTKTDKKRERRQKKLRQQDKQQEAEKKEKLNALKPGIAKKNKKDKKALLKKLTKDRNITKTDETTHKVTKSSTAFFTQLQDQVKSQIKAKVDSTSKKKKDKAMSAVKLKL